VRLKAVGESGGKCNEKEQEENVIVHGNGLGIEGTS